MPILPIQLSPVLTGLGTCTACSGMVVWSMRLKVLAVAGLEPLTLLSHPLGHHCPVEPAKSTCIYSIMSHCYIYNHCKGIILREYNMLVCLLLCPCVMIGSEYVRED